MSGTYSTIFVAAMIAILITERKAAKGYQGAASTATGQPVTSQRAKKQAVRRARAS